MKPTAAILLHKITSKNWYKTLWITYNSLY